MIEIKDKALCCGCTACSSVCPKDCIQMSDDNEGFKYPSVNVDLCINCGLCEKVCPINKDKPTDEMTKSYVARIKDDDILKKSTSGGAFSALSKVVFDADGVVFGGVFDDDFNVIHTYAEKESDGIKFRGSKYVQSDMGDCFTKVREFLDSGRYVLFSGTPCQTAGLLSYLRKPYDNLITVDFVCRAVPSPKVWKKYRDFICKKYNSKIKSASFRSKHYGYHCSSMKIDFENGKSQVQGISTNLFTKSFFQGVSCRPSCYKCAFKTVERNSDITVFDCWSISRYRPDKKDDDKGYSAVIVHNRRAEEFFKKASEMLEVYEADTDVLISTDGTYAVKSIDANPKREEYFRLLNTDMPLDKVVDSVIPIKTSKKIINKCKGILYKTHLLQILEKMKK